VAFDLIIRPPLILAKGLTVDKVADKKSPLSTHWSRLDDSPSGLIICEIRLIHFVYDKGASSSGSPWIPPVLWS